MYVQLGCKALLYRQLTIIFIFITMLIRMTNKVMNYAI